MGFLDKVKALAGIAMGETQQPQGRKITIIFGSQYMDGLRNVLANSKGISGASVDFPAELMQEIDDCVKNHKASDNVLYDDEMQFLDVVGESFRQDDLRELMATYGSDKWFSGFLMPEPFNPYDKNAVGVMLIVAEEEYKVVQVGYLGKEQAKKVQAKIIKYLEGGAVIPCLLKMAGGTPDQPSIGMIPRAKTKKIKF